MMKKKKNDQITDFNRKKNLVAQYTRNNNTEEEKIDKDPNGAKRTKNSQRRTGMLTF